MFALKNFKSLLLLLDKSDTKNAAYSREEEDKEEDKTGVSIALFLLLSLSIFLVGFSSISLTLYRSDLPPARSVRILIVSSLCLTVRI